MTLTSKSIGDASEAMAADFLVDKKLQIIETNYHSRFGEIDLIADEQGTLVFVEVKYRKSTRFGQPYEAVSRSKQQKIIRTAQSYLQKQPRLANKPCRFDVISIHNQEINWIQNAFDTTS